jgi:hypothetical protein
MKHPIRFAGAMHPSRAIRFGRTRRPDPRRSPALDALTAIVLGAASGVGLVLALSGGL